jgi:hypothetical protein
MVVLKRLVPSAIQDIQHAYDVSSLNALRDSTHAERLFPADWRTEPFGGRPVDPRELVSDGA